ncbi:MAG: hypothetical protein VB038_08880 [Methanobrevibacter sp.]|nr:hypothetical protein [Methanobrevibacter sp.]
MNKKKILILFLIFTIAIGFTITSVSMGSVNGYTKYQCQIK